jgi:hypothetical protein
MSGRLDVQFPLAASQCKRAMDNLSYIADRCARQARRPPNQDLRMVTGRKIGLNNGAFSLSDAIHRIPV